MSLEAIVFMIISLCLPGGIAAYSIYVQIRESKKEISNQNLIRHSVLDTESPE